MAREGHPIPDVEVQILAKDGFPHPARTGELLGTGKVVLFAVPGAFTPGCTQIHLPSFVDGHAQLTAKGVEKVFCISVNDPWVMEAWSEACDADDIQMIADGNGEFAVAMELTMDATGFGLGMRSQRYAAVVQDGIIETLKVEAGPGEVDISSRPSILETL